MARLHWHIGLPGPFSVGGPVGLPRRKRKTRRRTRGHSRGGSGSGASWVREMEATMTPTQLRIRNCIAVAIIVGVFLLIIL